MVKCLQLFLVLLATEILASSYFFPSSFTEVDLPEASITVSDAKVSNLGDNFTVAVRTLAKIAILFMQRRKLVAMPVCLENLQSSDPTGNILRIVRGVSEWLCMCY